jgi:hypothetical protein
MSQVVNRRTQFEEFKRRVCELLGITQEQYADMQLRYGRQYLQAYIPNDPDGIDQLLGQRIYWTWWRNHWAMRDEQFCVGHVESLSMKLRTELYHELHNPNTLASCIRPNGVILELAYAGMISNVNKSIIKA